MADERYHLDRLVPDEALMPQTETGNGRARHLESSYTRYQEIDEGGYAYLREILRRIRKHQWLIFFLALIITIVVTIDAFRSKSIYRATTTVELDKGSRTVYRTGDTTVESEGFDYPYLTSIVMKTNIRLLRSRPLLEDVVIALKLDHDPHFFDVTGRKSVLESVKTIFSRALPAKGGLNAPATVETPSIESSEIVNRSAEEAARLAPYVGVLAVHLSATQVEDTRMMAISFDHTNPTLAAKISNTAAQVFMDRSYRTRVKRFNAASDWLSKKTRELEAQVQQAELNLAQFASSNNLLSTGDAKENLTTEKLSSMYGQVLKAELDRILKASLYEEVKQGHVNQLPEAFADPKTAALRSRLDELMIQATGYAARLGPENPKVHDLNNQIAALQKQLDESRATLESRLKADYERTVREEKAIRDAFERAKGDAVAQNSAVIQYGMLKQEVEIRKGLYHNFLSQSSQADLQRADQYNNARIIEPAFVPTVPVGPNRLRTILIGLLASLALGVTIALVIEYLDNTVKTIDDISRYAMLPTLGVIPAIGGRRASALSTNKSAPRLMITEEAEASTQSQATRLGRRARGYSQGSLAEAYRGLRTSILLSAAGHAPKTILFTSSQPSEGKTTTTINTAISLTQLGASVLIIDADMRRPSTHRAFKVNHSPGLSTFLSSEADMAGLVQELPIPKLSLLPCGPVPPNPAELISSARMKELLRIAGERYDHVLIDSPPLINVSDPLILSTIVDGVILVVQSGRSARSIVRRARLELGNVGAKIFGVVLNNVDLKRERYGGAYYYNRYYSSDYHAGEVEQAGLSGD